MLNRRFPRAACHLAMACALPLLMFPHAAHAQAGAACRAGGTVEQTNACAVQDFQAADTTISILYGDVMRALSAHERPDLRQDQSAWQRNRVAQCKAAQRAAEGRPPCRAGRPGIASDAAQ